MEVVAVFVAAVVAVDVADGGVHNVVSFHVFSPFFWSPAVTKHGEQEQQKQHQQQTPHLCNISNKH